MRGLVGHHTYPLPIKGDRNQAIQLTLMLIVPQSSHNPAETKWLARFN